MKEDIEYFYYDLIDFKCMSKQITFFQIYTGYDQGTIIIDDTYHSDDSLTPSIKKIFEKGFIYIEASDFKSEIV